MSNDLKPSSVLDGSTDRSKDFTEHRFKALERVWEACRKDYEEKGDIFIALDNKAQATISLAGIFIAAVFAFLRLQDPTALNQFIGRFEIVAIASLIALLIAVVVLCLLALRVREVRTAPPPQQFFELTKDVLNLSPEQVSVAHHEDLLKDLIATWTEVLDDGQRANAKKASWVQTAQLLVAIAMISLAVLVELIVAKYAAGFQ